MSYTGIVYLTGAGPGDPELITKAGFDILGRADVIVYDNLANSELLNHVRPDAECIYVGKIAGTHAMKQEEINELLVEKAGKGNIVVRLKGGDPFVFGRGAEEALVLRRESIPFKIIPGVTSGVAASAYAGIPVTCRTCNSVVTFVTGHERPDKSESSVNWQALADIGGTLVFYMGMKNLDNIACKLIKNGRASKTPVAIIRKGTFPVQRVVEGTLADIYQKVCESDIKPPAIIVVGDVVNLREDLKWYEALPLFGKTILVTRAREQAGELANEFQRLGARVILFPVIKIVPPEDSAPMREAVSDLSAFDWVIFTSINAVDSFFASMADEGLDSRKFAGCNVCAIGSGTAGRLKLHGVVPDLVPERFTTKSIFESLSELNEVEGKSFFLPRADIANPELSDNLRKYGARVKEVIAYRTLPGEPYDDAFKAVKEGEVDVVTFTSSSTVKNFVSLIESESCGLPKEAVYAGIGPETCRTAEGKGIKISIEAEEHTIKGMVAAILRYFE